MKRLLLASCAAALLVACSSVIVPEGNTSSSSGTASSSGGASGGAPGMGGCGLSPSYGGAGSGGEGGEGSGGAAPFVTQWAKAFGLGGDLPRVAVDGAGMPIVLGAFAGTIDFGDGVTLTSPPDGSGFLARLSPLGSAIWAVPVSFAATTVVTGGDTAIWVLDEEAGPRVSRFDIDGNLLWQKTLDEAEHLHVAPAGDGGAFLVGSYFGELHYGSASLPAVGPGAEDAFLLRVDAAGNPVWVHSLGSLLWSTPAGEKDVRQLSIFDIAAAPGGDVVVAVNAQEMFGDPLLGCSGQTGLLARVDAQGKATWTRLLRPIVLEGALAVDGAGNVLIEQTLGHGESGDLGHGPLYGPGIALAMFDPGGKPRWGKRFAGSAGAARPVFDGAGNIVLGGSFFGSIDFGGGLLEGGGDAVGRIFLAKLSPHGAHLTSRSFVAAAMPDGGIEYDDHRGESVGIDASGKVFLVGNYLGDLDLGTGPLPVSKNGYGLVVARVSP